MFFCERKKKGKICGKYNGGKSKADDHIYNIGVHPYTLKCSIISVA